MTSPHISVHRLRQALYQLLLINQAVYRTPDCPWARKAADATLKDANCPVPDSHSFVWNGHLMPLHNPAALDGFILTEEDAGGLWAHLRVDLLVSKHPRVRAIVNRLHLEIAELETHYGKNPQVDVTAGRRNIWEPAIKGTRREDVPDIAVKTWVGSSGDTYSVQRKIVTAANLVHLLDGQSIPITAARHFSRGMHLILDVLEKAELVDRKGRLGVPDDQGFIDQFDEYHNRQDAFVIAQAYGRVNIERNGSTDELYSEGLH